MRKAFCYDTIITKTNFVKALKRKSKRWTVLREGNSSAVKFLVQASLKTTSELNTE
jgi:hypothetical protein